MAIAQAPYILSGGPVTMFTNFWFDFISSTYEGRSEKEGDISETVHLFSE